MPGLVYLSSHGSCQPPRVQGSKDWWRMTLILSYGTLGVVYGDIGTSPLYVMASVFDNPPSEADIVGVVSLIIWSIGALLGIK